MGRTEPAPRGSRDRVDVVIEPGHYRLQNLGDAAMLGVALRRVRARWPEASIGVHCLDPTALERMDGQAKAIDPYGAIAWSADATRVRAGGAIGPWRGAALEASRQARRRFPRLMTRAAEVALMARGLDRRATAAFLKAVRQADLFLVCGAGFLNDAFKEHALVALESIELALEAGATAALLGQGIGPVADARLLRRMALVLPRVDLVGLREPLVGAQLLEAIGVSNQRVAVTGDDAVALAHGARPPVLGSGIGVNVRVATYAGMTPSALQAVGDAVCEAARQRGTPLVPVPISLDPETSDVDSLRPLLPADLWPASRPDPLTVESLLMALASCRIVVAGSYHAAVLALSMGIPAVTVAGSEYYLHKFRGLTASFGPACQLEPTVGPDFSGRLRAAIAQAWEAAEGTRHQLLEAAARQISRSEAAARRVFDIVEDRRARRGGHSWSPGSGVAST